MFSIIVISLYVGFSWVLYHKNKDKYNLWEEVSLKTVIPVIICFVYLFFMWYFWFFFLQIVFIDLLILLLPVSGAVMYGIFNYPEFYFKKELACAGSKYIVVQTYGNRAKGMERNVYFNDAERGRDVRDAFKAKVQGKTKKDTERAIKLLSTMPKYDVIRIFVPLNEVIGGEWIKKCQIYVVRQIENKIQDRIIAKLQKVVEEEGNIPQAIQRISDLVNDLTDSFFPKFRDVLSLNCVELKEESVRGRKYRTFMGIEGVLNSELQRQMERYKPFLENVKDMPSKYEILQLKDEIALKDQVIEDLLQNNKRLKDWKETINSEFDPPKKPKGFLKKV